MKNRQLLWFVVCLLATMLAGCSSDDLLDDLPVEKPAQTAAPFQWTRAEDVETHAKFLRNFGVGYSYDAIHGEYCNWEDIRCQVLNREELEHRSKQSGIPMLVSQRYEAFQTEQTIRYSHRDYVQTLDLNTKVEVDLGLYGETKRKRQYVLEDGVRDCFYYMVQDRIVRGEQYIMPAEIMSYVEDEWLGDNYSPLLTKSFQEAVDYLSENYDPDDYALVDSFINTWGTHVVTNVLLGATMQLTLKNDMWRYQDNVQEEAFTSVQLMGAYNERKGNRQKENFTWTEKSSLYIECRGGDQSYMGNMIGEANYEGTRTFDMDDVSNWRLSTSFDPDNEQASNCEMVSMQVLPIWYFIPNTYAHVKQWLKAAILQDAAIYQQMLGDRNFFSVKFPIRYRSVSCQWRKNTGTWQRLTRTDSAGDPMVVNIMCGGRYVATVCHETIEGMPLWVCYPIYEGKVKQACGVGVADDNSVYDVCWINGKVKVLARDDKAADSFYINGGIVELEPQEEVSYPDYQALPYIELSGGVKPDGTYAGTAYSVQKVGDAFELLAPAGLTDIVGFTDTYRTSGDKRIYKRNDNNEYIYNQNEIK